MRTKLAAFTMVELIAVMILSGLIFSMAMLVLNIIQEQEKHQTRQHEEVLEIEQLSGLLKKDAYNSKGIWVENQQLFFDYETYNINYHFKDENICRSIVNTSTHTDTFRLPSLVFKTYWQSQEVRIGKVDVIEMTTNFFGQNLNLFIAKDYDYKTLIKAESEQQ